MKKLAMAIVATSFTLAGCATGSSGIVSSYSSPMMYGGYSCASLAIEDQTVRARAAELKGAVDRSSTNDKIMVGVGVFAFWPALFFIKGNGEEQAEYAELKGQHKAVEQAFLMKNCAGAGAGAFSQAGGVNTVAAPVPTSLSPDSFSDGSKVAGSIQRF